jgi:ribonuclease HI
MSDTLFSDDKPAPDAMPVVELYTDGGCIGNPGPGGWAYILKYPADGQVTEASGGEDRTTNNRMEITAVIRGLEALEKPSRVHLVGDSEYVLKGISEWLPGWKRRGWRKADKKPVLNADLWQRIDELIHKHVVTVEWTRGHAGHAENERCDELANAEAMRRKRGARG